MAVYEHNYQPYTGRLTPTWSRFLVIPRHAYQDIFKSRLILGFFLICFVYPLGCSLFVYLHYNLSALELLRIPESVLLPINLDFFYYSMIVQGMFAFFLNLLIGPILISRDLSNNAVPLYLCRPFSRFEYVLGKMSVLLILLSAITWIPQILIFFLQSYLAGWKWFAENYNIGIATFLGNAVWILILCLLSQAISALIKWRIAASGVLLALFFVPTIMAQVVNKIFDTKQGYLFSLRDLIRTVWAGLFHHQIRIDISVTAAWVMLGIVSLICLGILFRKVRAYEVVS